MKRQIRGRVKLGLQTRTGPFPHWTLGPGPGDSLNLLRGQVHSSDGMVLGVGHVEQVTH